VRAALAWTRTFFLRSMLERDENEKRNNKGGKTKKKKKDSEHSRPTFIVRTHSERC
jgi:hypothetical protein